MEQDIPPRLSMGRRQRLRLPESIHDGTTKSAYYVVKRRSRSRRGTRGTMMWSRGQRQH